MSQADPSEGAQTGGSDDGALARLEFNVCKLELAFHELATLLAEEEETPPLVQPLGWTKRRHRQLVKFSVIAGGLSALLASSYALPPQNPVHQAVRYTVNALVEQLPLPDFQPAVSLLSPLSSHPAADVNQPSASPLVLSHADPSPSPRPAAAPADQPAADSPASPQSSIPVSPATGPILLPSMTATPAPPPPSAPTAIPSPTPTSLPSGPAPSPTGGAGPSSGDQQQQQGKAKKPKPSPTP